MLDFVCSSEGFCTTWVVAMVWTVKLCWRRNVVGCTDEFACGSKVGIGDEVTWVVAFAVSFVCSSEGFWITSVVAVGWTFWLCWRRCVVGCAEEFACGSKVGIADEITWLVALAVSFDFSSEGLCTTSVGAVGSTVKLCWRRNVVGCTNEFACGSKVGIDDEVTWGVALAVSFVCSSEGLCTTSVEAVGWTVKLCWRRNVVGCTNEFDCGSKVGICVEFTWSIGSWLDLDDETDLDSVSFWGEVWWNSFDKKITKMITYWTDLILGTIISLCWRWPVHWAWTLWNAKYVN